MKTIKYRRTSEVKLTDAARLLKDIRLKSGLSIREVGRKLNRSECFVRHIEKGRLDIPDKERLSKILEVYGVTYRQYMKRLTNYVGRNEKDELVLIIKSMSEEEISLANRLIRSLIKIT